VNASDNSPGPPPPGLEEILIRADEMSWRPKSLAGVHEKMLWRNEETGASVALIKIDKGAADPEAGRFIGQDALQAIAERNIVKFDLLAKEETS